MGLFISSFSSLSKPLHSRNRFLKVMRSKKQKNTSEIDRKTLEIFKKIL